MPWTECAIYRYVYGQKKGRRTIEEDDDDELGYGVPSPSSCGTKQRRPSMLTVPV
jgi:hypothetical protein